MNKFLGLSAMALALAACDERPSDDVVEDPIVVEDPEDPTEPVITSDRITVGAIESGSFDDDDLVITVLLDGTDDPQLYTPNGTINGYDAFTQQESDINRAFTAVAGSNPDGSLIAVVAMDGGQFNRFFGGATIEFDGFSAPASGFYYYEGNYAGLLNFGGEQQDPDGVPDAVAPSEVAQVTGQVYLLADFVDNNVEGVVYDRVAELSGGDVDLQDAVLVVADIGANGVFAGTAEVVDPDLGVPTGAGSYTGGFDNNANYVAGIVALNSSLLLGTPLFENATGLEQEYGIFVIGQCPGNDPDACFGGP